MYTFWKNFDFIDNIYFQKVGFSSCDFDIFDDNTGCTTKFHVDEIYFFLPISVRSKVIAGFFVKKNSKVEHTFCDCN